MPSNNSAFHPSMVFNSRSLKQDTSLKTNTITNDTIGTHCYVRPDATVLADFSRAINKNISSIDKGLSVIVFFKKRDLPLKEGSIDEIFFSQGLRDTNKFQ